MIKLLALFILIPTLLFAGQGMGPGPGMPASAGGGGGFAGTKAAGTQSQAMGYQNINNYHSPFSATTGGAVNYIYFDADDDVAANLTLAYAKPVIWDSSGTVLASATTCLDSCTNVSGTLYRCALSSEVTLVQSTTYWIGFASGDNDFYLYTSDVAGNAWDDTGATGYTGATCNTASGSDQGTSNASYQLQVWVSNTTDDTHE